MSKSRPFVATLGEAQAIATGNLLRVLRKVKPAPAAIDAGKRLDEVLMPAGQPIDPQSGKLLLYQGGGETWLEGGGLATGVACPFGQPGDTLWIKETWAVSGTVARSDDPVPVGATARFRADDVEAAYSWRTPATMPRKMSRFDLLVEEVGVVWLRDVRHEDIVGLGISLEAFVGQLARSHGSDPADANPLMWFAQVRAIASPHAEASAALTTSPV